MCVYMCVLAYTNIRLFLLRQEKAAILKLYATITFLCVLKRFMYVLITFLTNP